MNGGKMKKKNNYTQEQIVLAQKVGSILLITFGLCLIALGYFIGKVF